MERGIGTSRGIGIGHVLIVYNASAVVNRGTHYNAEEEKKKMCIRDRSYGVQLNHA